MVRRIASVLLVLALVGPVIVTAACSSEPETEEQARVREIDAELADIKKKLDNPNLDGDEAEKLRDKQIELNAERTNVMRQATKKKERGE